MIGMDLASLMSSVFGLKARPRRAIRLFRRLPKCFLVLFLVMFKSLVFVITCGDVVGYCFC